MADLRPKQKGTPSRNKASILLLKAAAEHGYSSYRRLKSYEVMVQDSFVGFVGKQASPTREKLVQFKARYSVHDFSGALQFIEGKKKGINWAFKNGQSYQDESTEELTKVDNKTIEFWIPTYQYFLEFPFRIIEASALENQGKMSRNGKYYDVVLASWNTVEPQKELDQYLIWINNKGRIEYIDYTIREQYPFITGSAHITEYNRVEGIDFPAVVNVKSNLTGKRILHQMRFNDIYVTKM